MLWEQDIQCYGKRTLLAIAIHYYGKTSSDRQNVLHIVMRMKRQSKFDIYCYENQKTGGGLPPITETLILSAFLRV